MLRLAIEYVPPKSNVISNPLQAGRLSRSIFRLWDALAGANPSPPEFENIFRHRSFAGNICLIKSPRTREACATQEPALRRQKKKQKKEMPDRASLAIRHLVDVQLAAAKTELCVTVVSLSFQALSRSKVFTACPFG